MTAAPHIYRCHGLTVASELALPELCPRPAGTGAVEPDITIEHGLDLTARLSWAGPNALASGVAVAPDGAVIMAIPEVANFRIENGSHVLVEEQADADPGILGLYLIGLVLAVALFQRQRLVLHASAAGKGRSAILCVGDSGAGKSTAAMQFAARGYDVLTDDMAGISLDAAAGPVIWPASASVKLWSETIEALGMERTGLGAVANKVEKYFVRNTASAGDHPYTLAGIVVLAPADPEISPCLERLDTISALGHLYANVYRPEFIPDLGTGPRLFEQCAQVARTVPVFKFTRHRNSVSQIDLAQLVERQLTLHNS